MPYPLPPLAPMPPYPEEGPNAGPPKPPPKPGPAQSPPPYLGKPPKPLLKNPGPAPPVVEKQNYVLTTDNQSKAALIYDLITDNKIDILALQETWLPYDIHPAIKCDTRTTGLHY